MPIYEYHCSECDHTHEAVRSMSRIDEPSPCPKCGEPGQRKLSPFASRDGKYGRFFRAVSPGTPKPRSGDKADG